MKLFSHVGNEVASTCIESGQLLGYEQIYLFIYLERFPESVQTTKKKQSIIGNLLTSRKNN